LCSLSLLDALPISLAWILALFSSGTLSTILLIAATILSVFALPAAWTLLTAYSNKWRIEGNKGVAYLLRTISLLLCLLAVIILLFVDGINTTVDILISGMIGVIALPTAIWVVMSLYHKVWGKR